MTDSAQSVLMFVAVALITLNIYLATIPEIPRWVIILFGAASAVAVVYKERSGTSTVPA